MKVDGDTYTIYENGREVAKWEWKWSAIKGNSDANIDFLKRYNELRVEFMMAEEASIILSNEFFDALKSEGWITIEDVTYKLEWKPYTWQNNSSKTLPKWRIIYTETNAKTWEELKSRRVKSDSFDIPTGSNWDPIRNRINQQKNEYVKKNYKSK